MVGKGGNEGGREGREGGRKGGREGTRAKPGNQLVSNTYINSFDITEHSVDYVLLIAL